MKSLSSIKYILLALIVLGFFANFAQNDYGFDIATYSLIGLGLIIIADIIYYSIKEEPRLTKGKKKIKWIFFLILLFVLSFFNMFYMYDESQPMFIITLIFLLSSSFVLPVLLSLNKPMLLESILLFLLSIGFISKSHHWLGANTIIVISSISLAATYFSQSFIVFREIKKSNISLAFWVLCFFMIVIMSLLGTMFKIMRWQGAFIISILIYCLYFMFIIRVSIRRKFIYDGQKVTLWNKIVRIKGNIVLLFLFFTLAAIWTFGTMVKVVPGIYYDRQPQAFLKLWDEGESRRGNIYWENWVNFFDNREKSINYEKNE